MALRLGRVINCGVNVRHYCIALDFGLWTNGSSSFSFRTIAGVELHMPVAVLDQSFEGQKPARES